MIRLILSSIFAFCALCIAATSLLGHFLSIVGLYNWGASAGMAVPTSCGFILIGSSVILLSSALMERKSVPIPKPIERNHLRHSGRCMLRVAAMIVLCILGWFCARTNLVITDAKAQVEQTALERAVMHSKEAEMKRIMLVERGVLCQARDGIQQTRAVLACMRDEP